MVSLEVGVVPDGINRLAVSIGLFMYSGVERRDGREMYW